MKREKDHKIINNNNIKIVLDDAKKKRKRRKREKPVAKSTAQQSTNPFGGQAYSITSPSPLFIPNMNAIGIGNAYKDMYNNIHNQARIQDVYKTNQQEKPKAIGDIVRDEAKLIEDAKHSTKPQKSKKEIENDLNTMFRMMLNSNSTDVKYTMKKFQPNVDEKFLSSINDKNQYSKINTFFNKYYKHKPDASTIEHLDWVIDEKKFKHKTPAVIIEEPVVHSETPLLPAKKSAIKKPAVIISDTFHYGKSPIENPLRRSTRIASKKVPEPALAPPYSDPDVEFITQNLKNIAISPQRVSHHK